ncbi:unnamed protein product [Phytophthora lilii]|uniref:Unnamed protein product n=1 Tax=Phytophthora lilii TaxID=2077276 RepID=A0A9W6WLR4_9STRA|nr:unnamed protein product [Phytophthora lilii]
MRSGNDGVNAARVSTANLSSTPVRMSTSLTPTGNSAAPATMGESTHEQSDPAQTPPMPTPRTHEPSAKRLILGSVTIDEPEWKLVQHSQYGVLDRDGGKYIEPAGPVPCEAIADSADPHALAYTIPVTPKRTPFCKTKAMTLRFLRTLILKWTPLDPKARGPRTPGVPRLDDRLEVPGDLHGLQEPVAHWPVTSLQRIYRQPSVVSSQESCPCTGGFDFRAEATRYLTRLPRLWLRDIAKGWSNSEQRYELRSKQIELRSRHCRRDYRQHICGEANSEKGERESDLRLVDAGSRCQYPGSLTDSQIWDWCDIVPTGFPRAWPHRPPSKPSESPELSRDPSPPGYSVPQHTSSVQGTRLGGRPRHTVSAMLGPMPSSAPEHTAYEWRRKYQQYYSYAQVCADDLHKKAKRKRSAEQTRKWHELSDRIKAGFEVGDTVWLYIPNLKVTDTGYSVSPWVHVSRLKPRALSLNNPTGQIDVDEDDDFDAAFLPEDSWETDNANDEYEFETSLDLRWSNRTRTSKRSREYLIKWKGCADPKWI